MGYDAVDNKVIKCDFCGGDPLCVRFCSTEAIRFVDASEASLKKKKDAVLNLPERMGKYAPHGV
jgi:Fe-S-cluster-containing dehydrogenase component